MDYSKLSDFEINKRVLLASAFVKPLGYPHNADGRSVGRPNGVDYIWYDFCNNPADAFPIIEANRISLRNRYEGDWKAENEWGNSHFHISRNPLRSAMIVFLKMQESKNAKIPSERDS